MSDPHTMTVVQFATSVLEQIGIDPDSTITVPGGDPINPVEAWLFLTEKIMDAADEVVALLEKNK